MRPQPNEGPIAEILDAGQERSGVLDDEIIARVDDIADVEPEPKPSPVRKKDLGNGVHHPARYSYNLMPFVAEIIGYVMRMRKTPRWRAGA